MLFGLRSREGHPRIEVYENGKRPAAGSRLKRIASGSDDIYFRPFIKSTAEDESRRKLLAELECRGHDLVDLTECWSRDMMLPQSDAKSWSLKWHRESRLVLIEDRSSVRSELGQLGYKDDIAQVDKRVKDYGETVRRVSTRSRLIGRLVVLGRR